MKWRYQPVWQDQDGDRSFTLCECHFTSKGELQSWTADASMAPMGEDLDGLTQDLIRMYADAWKWKPVAFTSLHVGMTFERTDVDVEKMIAAFEFAARAGKTDA